MPQPPSSPPPRLRLQLSLAGLLVLMLAFAGLFALLRWLHIDLRTSAVLAGVFALAFGAAIWLVVAVARSTARSDEPPP
jgi:4-amino-4-deoxy-L-arabinose transferase-like glycosyltransferase